MPVYLRYELQRRLTRGIGNKPVSRQPLPGMNAKDFAVALKSSGFATQNLLNPHTKEAEGPMSNVQSQQISSPKYTLLITNLGSSGQSKR